MYNITVIKLSVKTAANIKDKIIGLIGKDKATPLMIKTRFGIHTFGLKFPIDILILNKENKIVIIKKNLKPNQIFFWNPRYEKVLELPQGWLKKKVIKMQMPIDIRIL